MRFGLPQPVGRGADLFSDGVQRSGRLWPLALQWLTTGLLGGAFFKFNRTPMRNLNDKRRALQAMAITLPGRLKAKGIEVEVMDNTDTDIPHIVVIHRPTAQWPDGRFLQIENERAFDADDVAHFFSGAA